GALVLSGPTGGPATIDPAPAALADLVARERPAAFETMHDCALQSARNRLSFHTWGDAGCCLPAGATAATLVATPGLTLAAGDLLLLEEIAGSDPAALDVLDPTRRHVVRLTAVEPLRDDEAGIDVVQVGWADADALPFPLCLSLSAEGAPPVEVAAARGNVVLADHGLSVDGGLAVLLGAGSLDPERPAPGRPYRPRLDAVPLVFADPLPAAAAPASACVRRDARAAAPAITLTDGVRGWSWRPDLLGSDRFAADFTVEVDDDGVPQLRFGDGAHGRAPDPGRPMSATFRIGGGAAGNVGAETLSRLVLAGGDVVAVRNPLPAGGGQDAEPVEQVRQLAPQAFRTPLRAVTEADYAEVAQRRADVQRAAAQFRWTGSWYTAFVTIDPAGRTDLDEATRTDVAAYLDGLRLAGRDVEVEPPAPVPIVLALTACADVGHLPAHVKAALQTAFSNRTLPGGARGFFHPDAWTFGQPLYLSQVYRAALAVPGVRSVTIDVLQRLGQPGTSAIAGGRLQVGRSEVVRCDSDPSAPDRGRVRVEVRV
ncbi:MAG TPA: putative baseplate assembly protein, partial [Candidatus Dormibacteraeota bacterium]|nr:putative baseplate assembly protein [Candidatus Dormibacteraeota bacterium]